MTMSVQFKPLSHHGSTVQMLWKLLSAFLCTSTWMPEVENEKNLYASCGWISNLAFGLLLLRCRAWEVDGRKATHVNYFWYKIFLETPPIFRIANHYKG